VRRAAAVRGEGEAADRDRAGRAGAVGRVAQRAGRQRAPGPGDGGEAVGPRRLERRDAAERPQRRAVAVGLLQAEPRLAGAPRRHDDRGRVDVAAQRDGDPGQRLALARAPRAADRLAQPAEQALTIGGRQREPRGGEGRGGHPAVWYVGGR
jgi:hypothetical protein